MIENNQNNFFSDKNRKKLFIGSSAIGLSLGLAYGYMFTNEKVIVPIPSEVLETLSSAQKNMENKQ